MEANSKPRPARAAIRIAEHGEPREVDAAAARKFDVRADAVSLGDPCR